jgi:aromatic-L-amino-acid decarboxylase
VLLSAPLNAAGGPGIPCEGREPRPVTLRAPVCSAVPMPHETPDPVPPAPLTDLDPDPASARALGELAVDLWVELLERLRDLPVARLEPAETVEAATRPSIPAEPMSLGELEAALRPLLFDHAVYAGHPGFLAYISGAGTVPGAAADLLAAGLNANVGGWSLAPGASEFERHLCAWFAERFGLPAGSGGLTTSGGAASNMTALKAARDAAGEDVRARGVGATPMAFYASAEAHATIAEAADLLGLGQGATRLIPTDEEGRIHVDALRAAIAEDRSAGVHPAAVVGTAGTTATGAIDPLPEVAEVAREAGAWFHVDGAYGGAAILSPALRPLLDGIERADSITVDAHKWLSVPQSASLLLVRDARTLHRAFSIGDVAYVREARALTGRGTNLGELGPQWSRSFSALKVWMSLAAHGTDAYARRLEHDVALGHYLAARVDAEPALERLAPVVLPIVCFRYVPEDLGDRPGREAHLQELNEQLMVAIRRAGRVFPSNAEIGGRYAIRACISNFRTEAPELDALVDDALALGADLDRSMR